MTDVDNRYPHHLPPVEKNLHLVSSSRRPRRGTPHAMRAVLARTVAGICGGPRRRAGLRQSGPLLRNRGWGSERARAGAFQDRLILGAVVELLRNFDRR